MKTLNNNDFGRAGLTIVLNQEELRQVLFQFLNISNVDFSDFNVILNDSKVCLLQDVEVISILLSEKRIDLVIKLLNNRFPFTSKYSFFINNIVSFWFSGVREYLLTKEKWPSEDELSRQIQLIQYQIGDF